MPTVAMNQISFLCDEHLSHSLMDSSFNFSKLNKEKTTVYLVIPPHYMSNSQRWLRLALSCAFSELIENSECYNNRVLFMLDEAYNLGYLSQLTQMLSLGRAYGVKIWTYWQDISQLRMLYGEMAHTFFSNSGVIQFYTPHDLETARFICDRSLTQSVMMPTFNFAPNMYGQYGSQSFNFNSVSFNETQVPLLSMNEVFGLPNDMQILFMSGIAGPIIAHKYYYYDVYPDLPTSQFFRI